VILSPFRWDDAWITSQYLAVEFAKRIPVVYVEPAPMWNPRCIRFNLHHLAQSLLHPRRRNTGVHIIVPRTVPFGRIGRLRQANHALYRRFLGASCSSLGLAQPLYWVYYYEGCTKNIPPGPLVYHCIDFMSQAEEKELCVLADIVLAVNEPLYRRCRALNSNTFLVPNGVYMKWFQDQEHAPVQLPKGKVIGFVGTISPNTNISLLTNIARAYPECNLVLVGPLWKRRDSALRTLAALPNVHMVGPRGAHEMPAYIRSFDVCLMPYSGLERIWYLDPLKLLQYLACGKPIVTPDIPAIEQYRDMCYVAQDDTDFLRLVGLALREHPDPALVHRRVSAATARDWPLIATRAWDICAAAQFSRLP
jgi:glycosyltransferase involved in cell wall biosynthesis